MKSKLMMSLLALAFAPAALAQNVTYGKHVRPLWEDLCERCHGAAAPTLEDFLKNRDNPAVNYDGKGPRMDSYEGMLVYVNGPRAGALMRMLDDGSGTGGDAGAMYRHLGRLAQRKQNLLVFKQWVGESAWVVKKPGEYAPEDLQKITAAP